MGFQGNVNYRIYVVQIDQVKLSLKKSRFFHGDRVVQMFHGRDRVNAHRPVVIRHGTKSRDVFVIRHIVRVVAPGLHKKVVGFLESSLEYSAVSNKRESEIGRKYSWGENAGLRCRGAAKRTWRLSATSRVAPTQRDGAICTY